MHSHPACFVDDDQILVFIQNRQRNCFRLGLDFFGWRFSDFDFISKSHRLVRPHGCTAATTNLNVVGASLVAFNAATAILLLPNSSMLHSISMSIEGSC